MSIETFASTGYLQSISTPFFSPHKTPSVSAPVQISNPPLTPAKMSLITDRHDKTHFTITIDDSDHIFTTVTSSGDDVKKWIGDILRIHRRRLHRLVVGLDAEWLPSSVSSAQNPVAVLQLCVGHRCLVFQICHADYIPKELSEFLEDYRFTFVGVVIGDDAGRLEHYYGLRIANTVDLRSLAAQKMGQPDLNRAGLARLAKEVMDVDVPKSKQVSRSNWDQMYLNYDQISYACADAFCSFEIGRRLIDVRNSRGHCLHICTYFIICASSLLLLQVLSERQ